MKVLVTGRQRDKTHKLVEWLKGSPERVLVVCNEIQRREVLELADDVLTTRVINFNVADKRLRGLPQDIEVGVDNLDQIIQGLLPSHRVSVVTMTGEPFDVEEPPSYRPDFPEYWINIAQQVAQRGTCLRAKVGAVLVSNTYPPRLLASGYNGSAPGEPHCIDVGCDIVDDHCQRTQHAEVNAVAFAARFGIPIAGSRLYLWINQGATVATVCRECAKVLKAAGVEW